MNVYDLAVNYFSRLPLINNWPELSNLFTRSALKKPGHWQLPKLACDAVGGNLDQIIPAISAIGCLQISILLVDDMLDADPRGEHHRLGDSATANLAIAFNAAGLDSIAYSMAPSSVKLAALISLNRMMLDTALGQYLDTQNPENEEDYWNLIRMKSSPFFGAALHVGALMGDASNETRAEQLKQIGYLYGEMIQIHDDLNDTLSIPANPDWTLGRMPLPILYASCVNHCDRERFLQLRSEIPAPDALAEAQNILIHSGAVSYCLHQLFYKAKIARNILNSSSLPYREVIDSLIDEIIEPVKKLFSVTSIMDEGTELDFFPSGRL